MISNTNRIIKKYLLLTALLFSAAACSSPDPIKIGFLGGLTGRVADLGIAGRDGAILAVESFNSLGGINGRPIELVIRDDKQDNEECRKAVQQLIADDVVAIVGPMTSSMALTVVPLINKHKILTISPTSSTEKLSDKDDYFLRIIPVSTAAASRTAEYAYLQKELRKMMAIYDLGNRAFTEAWFTRFKTDFELFGGKVGAFSYFSKPGYDFLELVKRLPSQEMDGLVILASAMDTAMISQQLLKVGLKLPVLASEWSSTEDVLEFGGMAVDGIEIFHSFDRNNTSAEFLNFRREFQKRFGYSAGFASAYAYNAVNIILSSLHKNMESSRLKENIILGGPYSGVQRAIQFNRFGDVERQYSLLQINNGKIETLIIHAEK